MTSELGLSGTHCLVSKIEVRDLYQEVPNDKWAAGVGREGEVI